MKNYSKKSIACFVAVLLFVSIAEAAPAPVKLTQRPKAKPGYMTQLTAKLTQGLANTGAGFIELPKNVVNISHDQNIFVGLTLGTVRGVVQGVTRSVVGVTQLLTAPIPTGDYISPPYPWSRFSEDTRYFGQHLPGFWTTYGPLDDGNDE